MFVRSQPMFAPDDGGGSAPAPAAPVDTPVSGETSTPGEASSGESFSGLGDSFDDNTIEIPQSVDVTGTVPAGAGDPPQAPVASTTPTPIPQAAPAVAPPAPAAAPQAQTPAPAPATPPAQPAVAAPQGSDGAQPQSSSIPADPAGLLRELEANREGVIDALASDARFGLSQDEVTALETDPGKVIPKILARNYYNAVNATLAHINNLVPSMIARHMKGTELQKKHETDFYSQFPALKPELHGNDVATFAQIFKSQNPSMTREDFFAMVGAAVMAKHKLMGAANGVPAQPAAAQAAPAPVAPPFSPASPGATVRHAPIEDNPFMGLGQEFDG